MAGLDGCKSGWVSLCLEDNQFAEARRFERAADAFARWPDLTVLAIDIPIGLSAPYPRAADLSARKFLGLGGSSVFPTPPREVLEEVTYEGASARSLQLHAKGLSRKSYGLRAKILEVNELAARESRVNEVHPEVSFREMAGGKTRTWHPKKTWAGQAQRRSCLASVGIVLPDDLGDAGLTAPDDILDAAAAAWSAQRIATGQARSLPDPPQRGEDRDKIAIYY